MEKQTKSPVDQELHNGLRIFKKKSLLFSSDDPDRLAEESSRARLMREFSVPDEAGGKSYEEYLSKYPNVASPYGPTCHTHEAGRNVFVTTYPSRTCLQWNPCVEVSSGEEIPLEWRPKREKSSCNCGNCTSRNCPSKKSSWCNRHKFKDNIVKFNDKYTMTVKLTHASCNPKTPLVSPNASNTSVRSSRSQPRFQSDYYPQYSKPVYRKPCPRRDSYGSKFYYDEAVRDTDLREDCPALRKAYARHCSTHNSGTQYGAHRAAKFNLYNEGISDKVPERYPASTVRCPHKVVYGGTTFCMNRCPNCRCRVPSAYGLKANDSRYHQRCKEEYNGSVYYDMSTENIRRAAAIPSYLPDRFTPPERASRSPSIILPKKVLTSERDIEGYIDMGHQCAYDRRAKRKKSK